MLCDLLASFLVMLGAKHIFRLNPIVELLFGDVTEFKGRLLESGALLMGILGNGSSFIVTNMGIKGGDQHKGLVKELADLFFVGFNTVNTVTTKIEY